jgi:hypothetical protein
MGKYFPLIEEAFSIRDGSTRGVLGGSIKKLLSKPLIPKQEAGTNNSWELPILGGELMQMAEEMGFPLKGKAISETIMKMIEAYQTGTLKLQDSDEKNKEEIKNFLSSTLKEEYVKDADKIEILKNRLSNILYK